jgi:hypothetical protein
MEKTLIILEIKLILLHALGNNAICPERYFVRLNIVMDPVGSGSVNCMVHASRVNLGFGTHDHNFVLSKTCTCFEMGPPLR